MGEGSPEAWKLNCAISPENPDKRDEKRFECQSQKGNGCQVF